MKIKIPNSLGDSTKSCIRRILQEVKSSVFGSTLTRSQMTKFILDNHIKDYHGTLDYQEAKMMSGWSDLWELKEIDPSMLADYVIKPRQKRNMLPIIVLDNLDGTYEILDGRHRVAEANYLGQKSILAYVGKPF